ncbi:hypothetical protein CcI49_33260 [Frankia sp. CcI49]|uniref:Uncharacterized protein n=1 Tax=Parafrankia irregularis TaxID=795642 RepID=A0A0S4QXP1_9ACTN|nr:MULTISPECIES: hypothetical protein [Frankiaceae]KPM51452.1 hypothetical protein ACG83_35655 [Frankia sp. R43]MBE3202842.1 hypothetical protein [Parafrankia sp. CH37]ONH52978.1 hypothetical protein CcI49_33260 [Frankia sp. CcI49]CUU59993.1 hypothetical protein Ga0074812_13423 [Parafrankia irregularis]
MRWEDLFSDLELQWEAAEAAELDAEIADRTRREAAYLRMLDRMRPAIGSEVRCLLRGGPGPGPFAVNGRLSALGVDWLLLNETASTELLVPRASLLAVRGLTAVSAQPGHEGRLAARLDLRHVVRGLVRDRSVCAVTLLGGAALTGTLLRVGADFLELAEHPLGEFARRTEIRSGWTIPFDGLAFIRRS